MSPLYLINGKHLKWKDIDNTFNCCPFWWLPFLSHLKDSLLDFCLLLHFLWSGDKIFGALNWTCFGFLTFTIWLKKQLIISYLVPGQCLNWSLLSFVDKRTEGERSTRSPFWMRSTTYRVLFLGQFWMRSTTSPMLAVLGQFLLQQQKLCHKPFLDWSWYQSQLSVCLCAGMPDVAWVA